MQPEGWILSQGMNYILKVEKIHAEGLRDESFLPEECDLSQVMKSNSLKPTAARGRICNLQVG